MIGLYFSGTGNTKHCVSKLVSELDKNAKTLSIEKFNASKELLAHNDIVLGYPIYYSNLPKIMHDFLLQNAKLFSGKNVFIVTTMGLFSGDGSGCAARILRKSHAKILGGLHVKMPDCIGDEKLLKKTLERNRQLVRDADVKIGITTQRIMESNPPQDGLSGLSHIAGLLGQRLWFYGKTASYKDKPNIDTSKCIGCGKCATLCPMQNLSISNGKAISHKKCTMCYRCVSFCPTQALTILGKTLHEQCYFEKYSD